MKSNHEQPSQFLSLGVPEDDNDRVSPQKHLADESISVNRKSFLLSFSGFRYLNKPENPCKKQHLSSIHEAQREIR